MSTRLRRQSNCDSIYMNPVNLRGSCKRYKCRSRHSTSCSEHDLANIFDKAAAVVIARQEELYIQYAPICAFK